MARGVINPSAARAKRVAPREPRGWGPAALIEASNTDWDRVSGPRVDDLDPLGLVHTDDELVAVLRDLPHGFYLLAGVLVLDAPEGIHVRLGDQHANELLVGAEQEIDALRSAFGLQHRALDPDDDVDIAPGVLVGDRRIVLLGRYDRGRPHRHQKKHEVP